MSFGKIKIRVADKLFREYLLATRGEYCELCGKSGRVEVSHFWGRRAENTRYSLKNCFLLCSYHHRVFHEQPAEHDAWIKKKLGKKEYDKLKLAAHLYCRRDDELQKMFWKNELRKLSPH